MRNGRSARHRLLSLRARPNGCSYNRYGFAVGKRVGGAVVRNRIKRRLRVLLRVLPFRRGYDFVVVAQPEAAAARFDELRAGLAECGGRLGLIEEPQA